ncbi:MAG: T9SS type A sorting domain-containing protein [Bacteroidetes bacterium]|nr:T9SS type A sorting domain-containing protein [Bacteroidota bacterium]
MFTSLSRHLVVAALMVAAPLFLHAQSASGPDESAVDANGGRCGVQLFGVAEAQAAMANTARNNPDVYRRIVERSKKEGGEQMLSVAGITTHTFNVLNRVTNQFDEVVGRLVFTGKRARIWIDERDTARVKAATIAALARGVDTATAATSRNPNKGLIENDEDVFGLPPVNRFDAATPSMEDFLLTDIQDNLNGGYIAGFFSPMDQTDYDGSNRMNLLYIDSNQGLGTQTASAIASMIGTLAHEYQHLIHYRQNPNSQAFYNEGCSETASILCGYKYRSSSAYLLSTNVPLFRWSDGTVFNDLEIDYERGMSFMRYCTEQYGEAFLTKFTPSRATNMNRVTDALTQSGAAADWKSTLKGYAVANYVRKNFADNRYIYIVPLSNAVVKPANTYSDSGAAAAGQAAVQQYAAVYNVYNFKKPSGLRIRFNATVAQNYAVMALLYQNGQLVDVREMTTNALNTIDPGYDKMVFAILSLSSTSQSIGWSVDAVTSGVESIPDAAAEQTAVSDISPNPATGPVRVGYRTVGAEPVTMQLFDMQGRLMRTMIAGVQIETGAHELTLDPTGLPAGVYLVRLTQGGAASVRAVVNER